MFKKVKFHENFPCSWEEMKIEHIRNAIDTQKEVMLEIIEKQGGPTTFLSSNTASKSWKLYEFVS